MKPNDSNVPILSEDAQTEIKECFISYLDLQEQRLKLLQDIEALDERAQKRIDTMAERLGDQRLVKFGEVLYNVRKVGRYGRWALIPVVAKTASFTF